MSPVTAILFDCDNTLVLSEPIAFSVCASLINQLLRQKHPNRTDLPTFTGPSLISTYVGQNFAGMLTSLQQEYNFSLTPEEKQEYIDLELSTITKELKERVEPCVGVDKVLKKLHEEKKYELAVVSSSAKPRVVAAITKVDQLKYFPAETHVFSAMTSLPTPTSKPDPAVYLFACEKLGKRPGECVAVEDSKSGILSAVRAGIRVIGYVGPYEEEERDGKAQMMRENGVKVVMREWSEFEKCLKEVEEMS